MTLNLLRYSRADADEIRKHSAADRLLPDARDRWVRSISISAPPETVYRWLCQLTVAPYSFDVIDFIGRSSPTTLTPGAENIAVGQHFLIFSITDFEPDRYIAGMSRPEFHNVYGQISVSYEAVPRPDGTTRLRANACLGAGLSPVGRTLLAAGDKVMAGRQLRRLRRLSEATHRQAGHTDD